MTSSKAAPVPQVYQFVIIYNTKLSEERRKLLPVEGSLDTIRPVLDVSAYSALSISGYETDYPLEPGRLMVEQFLKGKHGILGNGINRPVLPGDIVLSDLSGTWMCLPLNGLMELSKEDSERIRELFIYAVLPPWKRYYERDY
jgi:hypothetical protein